MDHSNTPFPPTIFDGWSLPKSVVLRMAETLKAHKECTWRKRTYKKRWQHFFLRRLGITCLELCEKCCILLGGTYNKVGYKENIGVFGPKTLLCSICCENIFCSVACLYMLILDFERDFQNYNSHRICIILSKRYDVGSFWPYAAQSYCISFIFTVVHIVSRNLCFRKAPARRAVLDEPDNTFTHNNAICIFLTTFGRFLLECAQ